MGLSIFLFAVLIYLFAFSITLHDYIALDLASLGNRHLDYLYFSLLQIMLHVILLSRYLEIELL